jgi:hypothetical protein
MASECFYQVMGEQVGPVSSAELRRLAQYGTVEHDTPVRVAPNGDWVLAESLRGLFAVPNATPPPMMVPATAETKTADSLPVSKRIVARRRPLLIGLACVVVLGAAAVLAGVAIFQARRLPSQQNESQQPADPLGQFKKIVEKVSDAWDRDPVLLEDNEPAYPKSAKTGDAKIDAADAKLAEASERDFAAGLRWRRVFFFTSDVSFDVEKTDSLVSPYTAVLYFKHYWVPSDRLSRKQAEAFSRDQMGKCWTLVHNDRVLYAYQEGKWVVKSIQTKLEPGEHCHYESEWHDDSLSELPGLLRAVHGN